MTEDAFWQIIEASRKGADGDQDKQEAQLKRALEPIDLTEIEAFERLFHEQLLKAYSWDLWGAAYIINGGCSDDGFEYFRRALVAAGRDRFEKALNDPESLAAWAEPDLEFEGIKYVAYDVYKEKSGASLPEGKKKWPTNPSGETWEEDSDDLETRFPRLWQTFSS